MPLIPLTPEVNQDQLVIKTSVELRERFENRQENDFDSSNPDNRSDLLSRWRPTIAWTYGDWTGLITYQYAHNLIWRPSGNSSSDRSDIIELNGTYTFDTGAKLTIGRQKMDIGSRRLISTGGWGNTGRWFDAVRYTHGKYDFFAGSIGFDSRRPRNARFAGVTLGDGNNLSMLVYKHDEVTAGDIDIFTLDHMVKRNIDQYDFSVEGAIQFGDRAGANHQAWAATATAGAQVTDQTRIYLEGNFASGGSGTTSRTFDAMYSTTHRYYGNMQLTGWQNLDQVALGLNHKVNKNATVNASYRTSWLRDPADAWYNQANRVLYRDATGTNGRTLGSEFNIEYVQTVNKMTSYQFGFAMFDPGTFAKNTVLDAGGAPKRQIWGYAMVTFKF